MPTFAYTARDRTGRIHTGKSAADNQQLLIMELQRRGWTPTKVSEAAGAARERAAPTKGGGLANVFPFLRPGKVKTDDLVVFTRQLATIVNAGLPLMQGLDILSQQTEDRNLSVILKQIESDVEGGETFSEALAKHPNAFSELYVSMVRAGEASGNLDGILVRLAEYLEASAELKRKIRSAMTYPAVAFCLVTLIAGGLLVWVVPKFEEIYAGFGKALPAPTRILIVASELLSSNLLWSLCGAVVLFIAVKLYASTGRGKMQIDRLLLKIPVFGKLFRKVAVSRVSRTLSTLMRSGVPILGALEIVERTAGNRVFAKAIHDSQESVRAGKTLAEPWESARVFPPMVTRMIGVGEKTGALETLLTKISDFYDSEVDTAVASLTSMIEPMLIAFLGVTVGFMVIALFLPILSLSSLLS